MISLKKHTAGALCLALLFSACLSNVAYAAQTKETDEKISTQEAKPRPEKEDKRANTDNKGLEIAKEKLEENKGATEHAESVLENVMDPKLTGNGKEIKPFSATLTGPIDLIDRVGEANFKDDLDINNANGAATYSKGFYLPPGRNGFTPNIGISYDSSKKANDSLAGFGWDLSQYYISLNRRYGVDKMYDANEFVVNSPGGNGEIVAINLSDGKHGEYGLKVEESFQKYEFLNDDTWKITDKAGNEYYFGTTAASRQDDLNDTTRVYKWMLDEIQDKNGNWIKYDYYKDAGEIYPRSINYTGHDVEDGLMTVKFQPFYDGPTTQRLDHFQKYTTGFFVETNYILENIEVEIQGQNNGYPMLRYDFDYTTSQSNKRSLLTSLTEVGIDANGVETAMPSTDFTYSDEGNTTWIEDPNWTGRCLLSKNVSGTPIVTWNRLVDRNYDGLLDCGFEDWGNDGATNTGSGFSTPILYIPDMNYNDHPKTAMLELNGDGKVDFLESIWEHGQHRKDIEVSGTNPGFTTSSIPEHLFQNSSNNLSGFKTADMNADGLTDLVHLSDERDETHTPIFYQDQRMFINNGVDGWDLDTGWSFSPYLFWVYNQITYNSGWQHWAKYYDSAIYDYNNDGLQDIILERTGTSAEQPNLAYKYINNGNKGFEVEPVTTAEWASLGIQKTRDYGIRMVDLNNDGLLDFLKSYDQIHTTMKMFDGIEYVSSNYNWDYPAQANIVDVDDFLGVAVSDINGDGVTDLYKGFYQYNSPNPYVSKAWIGQATIPDMLIRVDNNKGSQFELEYKNSPLYRDSNGDLENPNLYLPKMTVERVTYHNDFNTDYIVDYLYEDGEHIWEDSFHNDFAGFHVVTKTDNMGLIEKTYYHQGGGVDGSAMGEYNDHISKKSKPYRTEVYDGTSKYNQSIYKWDHVDLGNGRSFPKMIQEVNFTFDGEANSKDAAVQYTFDDSTGNMIESLNLGEVNANGDGSFADVGSDSVRTVTTYTNNTADHIIGLSTSETLYDNANNKVAETQHLYDNLPFGQATSGNKTMMRNWVSGSNYLDTNYVIDTYGHATSQTSPRGFSTTAAYDLAHLYPETLTNHLGQTSNYDFHYLSGSPSYIEGPNGDKTRHYFDSFGRHIRTDITNPASPANEEKVKEVIYHDSTTPHYKETKLYDEPLDTDPLVTREYFDGNGSKLQTKKTAPNINEYVVVDSTYDKAGRMTRQSLPYFTTGIGYIAPDMNKQANNFTYDILGRVLTVSNILGSTSSDYSPWEVTVTDPLGTQKRMVNDAYGRLDEVHEFNEGDEYTTYYEYTPINTLKKITDHYNNIRDFQYDGIGRLTYQNDLHAPADTGFSTWTYGYDANSNVTTATFGDANVVTYSYDEMDRVLTEDSADSPGAEITYTYDTAHRGIGKLGSINKSDYSTSYEYDALGRVEAENTQVKTENFRTEWKYDLQGKLKAIRYPDSDLVEYNYKPSGHVDSIEHTGTQLVHGIQYTPLGQIQSMSFGNGAYTVNEYPEAELYRLTHITTTYGDNIAQDLSYTYDALNNLTHFEDYSSMYNQKIADYTYDDLSRLITAHAEWQGDVIYDETYSYDAVGNITNKSGVGAYVYGGVGNANPHAVTQAGSINVGYDDRGNLNTKDAKSFNYNYKNELAQFTEGDFEANFLYDQSGSRVWKNNLMHNVTDKGGVWIGDVESSQEYNLKDLYTYVTKASGQISYAKKSHIYLNDQQIASIYTNDYPNSTPNSRTVYHHRDHLGSASIDSSDNGVEEWNDYYPWGEVRNTQSMLPLNQAPFDNDYKFTGQEYDSEMGMYYYDARYYDPELGRFAGVDKLQLVLGNQRSLTYLSGKQLAEVLINPQALNFYTYVANNPLKYTDPTGNCFWDLCLVEGAVAITAAVVFTATVIGGAVAGKEIIDQSRELQQEINNMESTTTYTNTSTAIPVGNEYVFGESLNDIMELEAFEFTVAPDGRSLLPEGVPGSKDSLYGPDGKLKQDRVYGPDGKAEKDTDYDHYHDGVKPHEHDWVDGERQPGRPVENSESEKDGDSDGGSDND